MTPIGLTFVTALLVAQFILPRRLAFAPLVIVACHFGNLELIGQFTPVRLIILAGLVRALVSGSFVWSPSNRMDQLMAAFAFFCVFSAFFRNPSEGNPYMFRTGLAFNVVGTYLYGRAFIRDNIAYFAQVLAIVMLPLGALMMTQQVTGFNAYEMVGSRGEAVVRADRLRAHGPFRHAILAGTAGATAMPFMLILWRRRRGLAVAGLAACAATTVASASSGPILSAAAGLGAVWLWRFRRDLRLIQWGVVGMLLVLQLLMARPIWHLMARIDIVGGSTGWHRARLLDAGFGRLNEWWFAGTDYTRHWMPSGVQWSQDQSDITNYYLHLGVIAGLPLMLTLIFLLVVGFRMIGRTVRRLRKARDPREFIVWCAGAVLFAHTITFVSVSYFDQMFVFFYLLLGAIPWLGRLKPAAVAGKPVKVDSPLPLVRVRPGSLAYPAPAYGR